MTFNMISVSHLASPPAVSASQFVSLLDCGLSSPLYSPHHRQLFQSWKQKVKTIWTSYPLTNFIGNVRH